jgi:hypothetical protein
MVRDRQEIARYLVRRGCETDILMAAALGDAELVRKHLAADPDCLRVRVSDEYFPMINRKSGGTIYQWTLGWYVSAHEVAKQSGHEDIFQLLMEQSPADVKLLTACWAADEIAVKSQLAENPGLASSLSEANRRQVAHAARNNNAAVVRVMLVVGLPVDALGQHRATPLHWAAFHGNVEMARDILRHNPPLKRPTPTLRARHWAGPSTGPNTAGIAGREIMPPPSRPCCKQGKPRGKNDCRHRSRERGPPPLRGEELAQRFPSATKASN